MAASGALSSWLTSSRNSARERSSASNGARSWMVTTTVSTAPSAERIGVASSSVRTLRPPGTESSTSSARTRSALPRSASVTSRPSPRRQVTASGKPLEGMARREEPGHDALRLPVEGHRRAGGGVEHHDADGRGLDQRLQVGPGAPLVAVRARVGDGRRRLLREQRQHRLVPVREPALLLREEEAAHGRVPVTHRRAQQGPAGERERRTAERAGVVREVRQPPRRREAAQVLEEPEPVGPRGQRCVFLRREAGGDEVEGAVRNGRGVDGAVAGAGERAGALDGLAQHGVEVEARADAQDRRDQGGTAVDRVFGSSRRFVEIVQRSVLTPRSNGHSDNTITIHIDMCKSHRGAGFSSSGSRMLQDSLSTVARWTRYRYSERVRRAAGHRMIDATVARGVDRRC